MRPARLRHHKRLKHMNLAFLVLSVFVAVSLSKQPWLISFLQSLGGMGYIGAFIAGIFFVSTFTISTCVVILSILAQHLSLPELIFFASLGAVVGDIFVFRSVKDGLFDELKPIYKSLGGNHLNKILHTRHFRWTLPVLGALIIASPLPDELGVTLLGISRMSMGSFVPLSFVLNAIGILSLTATTRFFT